VRPSREEVVERIAAMRARDVEAGMGMVGDGVELGYARREGGELFLIFLLVLIIMCVGTAILLVVSGKVRPFLEFLVRL